MNTIFRRDFVPGATQLRRYGFVLAAIILLTEIGFLQRTFSMVDLTLGQGGSASASRSAWWWSRK